MKIVLQGEIHSSKNSRRIFRNSKTGAPFVTKSKQAKEDESMLALQLSAQRSTWFQMAEGVPYPLLVRFRFRRETKRPFDYVNMVQGILDSMVKVGYMPDDNMNYVIPSFSPYILDKENPGCDIEVL